MSTYWIVGETEERLRALRAGMKKAKGREVSFTDVIEALLEISRAELEARGWIGEQH